jgi:uncharacterized Zn-finger protein
MSNGENEVSLHDKLQEQVTTSVRDALEKSTSILSNLHRLSSYLDVMNAMLSHPDRLKNSLDQIQSIRSDCASLLQTIYLGELGLQSLQDITKTTSVMSTMMEPLFSDSLSNNTHHSDDALFQEDESISLGKRPMPPDEATTSSKRTVAVYTCNNCQRMFGANADPDNIPTNCRKCNPNDIHVSSPSDPSNTVSSLPSPLLNSTSLLTEARKQLKKRVSKRSKLNPVMCRLCSVSFFYKRCMLRHLRETHGYGAMIDLNNLDQYIVQGVNVTNNEAKDTSQSSLDHSMEDHPAEVQGNMSHQSLDISHSADNSYMEAQGLQGVEHVLLSTQPSLDDQSPLHNDASQPNSSDLLSSTTNIDNMSHQSLDISVSSANIMLSEQSLSSNVQDNDSSLLTGQSDSRPSDHKGSTDGNSFKEYKCIICNKAFDRPYRLTRHLEIHDPNRPRIRCDYCNKSFTRKDSLDSHIKTVHSSFKPYTCAHETCNRSFSIRSMYLNHQKVHGEYKPHHCQECKESFTLLAELKDHLKKDHPENEERRCSECFKVCLSLEDLEHHKMYDHRYECEICGKTFARLAYLQVHVKVHNGESKFNCRFCSEGFNSIYAYRQHMKTHPEYRRAVNVFPCHACDKVFNDPSELVAHYPTEEHKEKAGNMGATPSSSLEGMEGDLSVMNELVTHVVMNNSQDMINSIV